MLNSLVFLSLVSISTCAYVSILGDPKQLKHPQVAWTGWNFCNGALAPSQYNQSISPRLADCIQQVVAGPGPYGNMITQDMNDLGVGIPIPPPISNATTDINWYAVLKEQFLASICQQLQVPTSGAPFTYNHWSIMFKSGNMNTGLNICPATNVNNNNNNYNNNYNNDSPISSSFNNLPMNQPFMVHQFSTPGVPGPYGGSSYVGYFAGTYDLPAPGDEAALTSALETYTEAWFQYRIAELDGNIPPSLPAIPTLLVNKSYLSTLWYQNTTSGSFVFYNLLVCSKSYPWLMNYARSNVADSQYGGYPYTGGGIMSSPAPAIGTNLSVKLNVLNPGEGGNQFYLPEISGCWRLDGSPCGVDSDISKDVTRYICFVVNPAIHNACSATNQGACPPVHYKVDGTKVYRNDTKNFPYQCYLQHCYPPGSPESTAQCDAYSNPNPQELMQILPCEEWAAHGFPVDGQGWVGDARTWNLDVGALTARVFFSGQEPAGNVPSVLPNGLPPYPGWNRTIISFEIGPEQLNAAGDGKFTRWEVTEWDVLVNQ
jgi:hypothetical protein